MKVLAVACLTWLVHTNTGGCGGDALTFSYVGSHEGLGQATEAAEAWNRTCGTAIRVTSESGHIPLHEVESVVFLDKERSGKTVMRGRDVRLIEFERAPNGAEVLTHEFGHALGIVAHTDGGVMNGPHQPGSVVTLLECGLLP